MGDKEKEQIQVSTTITDARKDQLEELVKSGEENSIGDYLRQVLYAALNRRFPSKEIEKI